MKQHEFLQPRKGFEDFVELFGSLTIGDWDGEYFVSWREAYRSETIYRRRVIIELDCQFRPPGVPNIFRIPFWQDLAADLHGRDRV